MATESNIKIQFLGAAGTVTGSKFLLTAGQLKILIDCGLFQGIKSLREQNWKELPVNPETIDTVLLTHGHLDHTGYLPRLVKMGYSRPVFCTFPTAELAEILLLDSAHIQEEEAHLANKHGFSKHSPAKPLYDKTDAKKAIALLSGQKDNIWYQIDDEIKYRFRRVGHIIGASFIEIVAFDKRIVFSGDVGRVNDIMLEPPERPAHADALVIESTYGNRIHPDENTENHIRDIINEAHKTRSTVIIPSFTVDRAQDIMYHLYNLKTKRAIPDIPVYLDTPMGTKVSNVYAKYDDWHKLGSEHFDAVFSSIKIVRSFDETKEISADSQPKIVIAGSGMMTGGRILQYLKDHLGNKNSTILIVGYQAEGTRGRSLLEGEHEIKIHGEYFPVKAQIRQIKSMSSHADQNDLLDWLSAIQNKPNQIFIAHGEAKSANAFRVKLKDKMNWQATIPQLFDEFDIY